MEHWSGSRVAFPLVVSGPSGVGKTSVVDRLLDLDPRCVRSVSATTRPRRPEERDGESYFFVAEERFLQMREAGELAEWTLYQGHLYGTPKETLEKRVANGLCVVLNIEVDGGEQVRSHYPSAVLVFVIPPSWDHLRRRLRGRGTDGAEAVEARIRRGHEEMEAILGYDYVVVNDDLDRCAADLASILRAERRRIARFDARGTGGNRGSDEN